MSMFQVSNETFSLFSLVFSKKRHVIALHFGWTCCFKDKDFFDTTSVHNGIFEVLKFAIKKNIKTLENFKIYLKPTEIFRSRHIPHSMTLYTFDVYYLLAFKFSLLRIIFDKRRTKS